ncbi:hypothetical protein [Flavobacterium sp.]
MKRLEIIAKDIQSITGKSDRYGRSEIQKIKLIHNKSPHQMLTIEEYCSYKGLDLLTVLTFLNAHK